MTLKMNLFFAFLAIGSILFAGCLSPQGSPGISTQTAACSACFSKHAGPYDWSGCPLPATTVATFTRDQVSELFIDIAFGCDTTRVNKFSPSSDNHMFYSLEGQVRNDDLLFMKNVTKNYNLLMSVEAFSDDPFSSQGNPIIIYPRNSLDSLEKTSSPARNSTRKAAYLSILSTSPSSNSRTAGRK